MEVAKQRHDDLVRAMNHLVRSNQGDPLFLWR